MSDYYRFPHTERKEVGPAERAVHPGQLPTGTVTFLFTDIEGSTRLAQDFPDVWPKILRRHHFLLRVAVDSHHGFVFRTIGDELNAAFETPLDALMAAVASQRFLQTEDWGSVSPVRVRMALHTGPATPRSGEYDGYLTLSHTKRLVSTAHGGQILLSQATGSLLSDSLPPHFILKDLGEHRLKDFERSEHIYQLVAQDLPNDFPPLRSLKESAPHHLPVQLTSFIGRSKDVAEVKQLLSKERLVTLTGPGGSGKTRLALQVASELIPQFEEGAFFVGLAPISDAGLIPATIAQTLGVTETAGQSILDRLKDYLQGKSILLLLDNFEHLMPAAPLVADLLVNCSKLKVFVTSREGLRISGEQEYPVLPLELPDLSQLPPLDSLAQYPAIELFVQRAQSVKPDFQITNETAQAVAEICSRLDGLPLAIELAAARVKLMSPPLILARLGRRLEFLTGGGRDLPARQQTLRNTIAWSYDLLHETEQQLFCQISIFVGGCTLDAIEAVAGQDPSSISIVDQVSSLLDKSLLKEVDAVSGEPRFVMLDLLREFGLEKLEASGERETIQHRHASYFLTLAEQAGASMGRSDQIEWMNRLEQEHGNLRLALEWSRTAEGAGEICLRLAGILGQFWEARGYYSEGRERLATILATETAQGSTTARARLLARAAELAYRQSDYPATSLYASESLSIYRQLGDRQGIASALVKLGNAAVEVGDYAAAPGYLEEALSIWRELGDKQGISRALISFGWAALRSGDDHLANARLEEALALSRQLGDTRRMGFELAGLGEVAMRQGNYPDATRLVEESLDLRRQLGNKWGVGVCLGLLGWIAMHEGKWDLAVRRLAESLEVRQEIGDKSGIAWCLERLAEIAVERGQAEKAVSLYATAAALRRSIGSVVDPVDQPEIESKHASLSEQLGEQGFAAHWDEGSAMPLSQALAYALKDD